MHHEGNCYMKILISLLFCFMSSVLSYGQNDLVQNAIPLNPSGSESLLDTSNMYNSRYGAVARLTQDNMPCIMPNAFVTPIPNAAVKRKKSQPDNIPNFWKYKRPPAFQGKPMPIPESLQKPQSFKSPGMRKQEVKASKPIPGIDNQIRFPIKDRTLRQP